MMPPALVLASQSEIRARLLTAAGLAFAVAPAHVDEDEIKRAHKAEGVSALDAATALAELKAARYSSRHPGVLVIGADQILCCDEIWFDKPVDMSQARSHLQTLRGRTHELATAAVVLRDGQRIWHHGQSPRLTMSRFDDDTIDRYLAAEGSSALASVGAYRLEGAGVRLFDRIDGDFFAILGLPLMALLDFLAEHGIKGHLGRAP